MRPRVLVGYSRCLLTQRAFRAAGCETYTCDVLDADHSDHLHMDVWDAINGQGPWDFAVLHPMCTYLTVSAAWAFKAPDFERYPGVGYHQRLTAETPTWLARQAVRQDALGNFERLLALPFPVAVENPARSFVNKAIRPPDQVVHPYEFGDDASKATGFWLSPGVPLLVKDPLWYVQPRLVEGRKRWANQTDSGQNRLTPGPDRWLERSRTYPGIARAMGSQWGLWLRGRQRG